MNDFDLDGERGINWKAAIHNVTRAASIASMIPGPIGMVASGVALGGYLAQAVQNITNGRATKGWIGALYLFA